MHELIEDVLPFLVAFYLLDGLALVRRYEWLLLAPWRRFAAAKGGLHLVGLSPLAEAVSAFEVPIRFGRTALHVEARSSAPGGPPDLEIVPLEGLPVEVEERRLKLGELAITLPSAAAAQHLAAIVRDVRDLPPGDRPPRLRAVLKEAVDLGALRGLRSRHQRYQRVLQWLGLGLFLVTFLLLPAGVLSKWERGPGLGTVLVAGALLHAGVVAVSWTALRHLGFRRGSAVTTLLPLAFFPPAAAHASVLVFRDLYARFDPVAVAGIFLQARRVPGGGAGRGASTAAGSRTRRGSRGVGRAPGTGLDAGLLGPGYEPIRSNAAPREKGRRGGELLSAVRRRVSRGLRGLHGVPGPAGGHGLNQGRQTTPSWMPKSAVESWLSMFSVKPTSRREDLETSIRPLTLTIQWRPG